MSEQGIYYKKLLKQATLTQALKLCPTRIRDMLSVTDLEKAQLSDEQLLNMAIDLVDIIYAANNETGRIVLLELIKQWYKNNTISVLAKFTGLETNDEDTVYAHISSNPRILTKFLRMNDISNQEDIDLRTSTQLITPEHKLRYYQLVDARKISTQLANGGKVLYHAPTGAGKTRTAMSVVSRHMINNGPTKVLWLASSAELIDQAVEAFKREWQARGDSDSMVYQWRGGGSKFAPEHATDKNTVLVASVQLLARRDKELEHLISDISLIVFDEAHQSLAPTYQNIVETIMKEGRSSLLGLSATPSRAESDEASAKLAEMYGGNKITLHCPKETNPIAFLIQEGYLSQHEFHKISIDIPATPKPKPNSSDYDNQLLEWLGHNVERNVKIVELVKHSIDDGNERVLVFTPSVDSARYCARLLKHKHDIVGSYVLTGDTHMKQRAVVLRRYSDTDPAPIVIFNYGVLTTGFDAPKTSAVLIARPTKSPTLYTQMVGRALRGIKSGGTSFAVVYTITDQALEEFSNLAELFLSFEKNWS